MKEYFTTENTDGFLEQEIKNLNQKANAIIGENVDPDYIKSVCDRLTNEFIVEE
jgi:hypothetical protein